MRRIIRANASGARDSVIELGDTDRELIDNNREA